jgi:hypothetical protein
MYIIFADATRALLAVAALAVGFGLWVAALMLQEAFRRLCASFTKPPWKVERLFVGVRHRPHPLPQWRSRPLCWP